MNSMGIKLITWKKQTDSQKSSVFQEEIKIINNPVASTEIEAVIKNLPNNKGPDGFTGEFHKTFRELMPILLKVFQKIAEEGTFPNSFYEATITLIPKPDKDNTKNYRQHY